MMREKEEDIARQIHESKVSQEERESQAERAKS